MILELNEYAGVNMANIKSHFCKVVRLPLELAGSYGSGLILVADYEQLVRSEFYSYCYRIPFLRPALSHADTIQQRKFIYKQLIRINPGWYFYVNPRE